MTLRITIHTAYGIIRHYRRYLTGDAGGSDWITIAGYISQRYEYARNTGFHWNSRDGKTGHILT